MMARVRIALIATISFAEPAMLDFLSRFNSGEIIALVAIVGGLLVGPIIVVLNNWHEMRKTEMLNQLKQEMLDRGMSADEIRTVLEAGAKKWPL
jgi:hypothetical protein